jgi:hypothetical protein
VIDCFTVFKAEKVGGLEISIITSSETLSKRVFLSMVNVVAYDIGWQSLGVPCKGTSDFIIGCWDTFLVSLAIYKVVKNGVSITVVVTGALTNPLIVRV